MKKLFGYVSISKYGVFQALKCIEGQRHWNNLKLGAHLVLTIIRPTVKKSSQCSSILRKFLVFLGLFLKNGPKMTKNHSKIHPNVGLSWLCHRWSYNCEDQRDTNFQIVSITLIFLPIMRFFLKKMPFLLMKTWPFFSSYFCYLHI